MATSFVYCQDYPNRPVRIITSAAGGGNDFTSRLIAQGISGPLGQQVIVENRGNATLSSDAASKASPDGYTIHVAGGSTWITPLLQKASWDAVRDLAPISMIEKSPNVLAVHPSLPVKSVKELMSVAKARPGELNYASTGPGGATHLAAELFKSMAGVNILQIPYKGVAPAITGLLTGEVQLTFSSIASIGPQAKAGRLRALASTSAQQSALLPGLPTIAATVPGYELVAVTGIWTPARTPEAIIRRLNQEIVRFVGTPDARETFKNTGIEVVGGSPEEFAAFIRADMARMGKVIKDANIRVD